jgi:hypothetical protein
VVYGTLVMAALQRAFTGVAFWILGLRRLFFGRLSLAYVHSFQSSGAIRAVHPDITSRTERSRIKRETIQKVEAGDRS